MLACCRWLLWGCGFWWLEIQGLLCLWLVAISGRFWVLVGDAADWWFWADNYSEVECTSAAIRWCESQGRLLHGDTKDRATMTIEARTSPPLPDSSNDYLPRVLPFFLQTLNKYGRRCFVWNGPVPLVTIAEPELIREVFMKIHEFQKPRTNPLLEKVASGLVMLEGQFWATRRKLLTPAFHMDKLKQAETGAASGTSSTNLQQQQQPETDLSRPAAPPNGQQQQPEPRRPAAAPDSNTAQRNSS
uniref:Uncharacterized protein n=1 Tax=Chenopodium quinoa TaxID=63459 RepID=A0A803LW47_CHEQI